MKRISRTSPAHDISNGLCREMLIAERPKPLAVGNAAIGLGVKIEPAELLADADDQPSAVDADAFQAALMSPGRAEPGSRGSQDVGAIFRQQNRP